MSLKRKAKAPHHGHPEDGDHFEKHPAQVFEVIEERFDRLGLAVFAQAEHFLSTGDG